MPVLHPVFRCLLFLFFFNALAAKAQRPVISFWELRAPVGSSTVTPFGLKVSGKEDGHHYECRNLATLVGEPPKEEKKRVFHMRYMLYNIGKDPILITGWEFHVFCPRNNVTKESIPVFHSAKEVPMGAPQHAVMEVTRVVGLTYNWLMRPGDTITLFASDNDFYWCLDDNKSSLLEAPKSFCVRIGCAPAPTFTYNSVPTPSNTIYLSGPGRIRNPPTCPPAATFQAQVAGPMVIEPEIKEQIKECKKARSRGDSSLYKELKAVLLELAAHLYPNNMDTIHAMLNEPVQPSSSPTRDSVRIQASAPDRSLMVIVIKNEKHYLSNALTGYQLSGTYRRQGAASNDFYEYSLNIDGTGQEKNYLRTLSLTWGLECDASGKPIKTAEGEMGVRYLLWIKNNEEDWHPAEFTIFFQRRKMAIYGEIEKAY